MGDMDSAKVTLGAHLSTTSQIRAVPNISKSELLREPLRGVEANIFLMSMSEPVTHKSWISLKTSWGVRYWFGQYNNKFTTKNEPSKNALEVKRTELIKYGNFIDTVFHNKSNTTKYKK